MKDKIIEAYNNLRDCHLKKYELSMQEIAIKQQKIAAHKQMLLAKEEIENLKDLCQN